MFISEDGILELARIEAEALRAVAARMAAAQKGEAFHNIGGDSVHEDSLSARDAFELRRAA